MCNCFINKHKIVFILRLTIELINELNRNYSLQLFSTMYSRHGHHKYSEPIKVLRMITHEITQRSNNSYTLWKHCI